MKFGKKKPVEGAKRILVTLTCRKNYSGAKRNLLDAFAKLGRTNEPIKWSTKKVEGFRLLVGQCTLDMEEK